MQIQLPEHVKYILKTFRDAGYEAYAVGGCVRDSIMGRQPNDWDVCTSASPQETKECFSKKFIGGVKMSKTKKRDIGKCSESLHHL